ncbi:MAG: 30S ribosomal protein S4 [Thermotogae bacterium]|nr:30S ribosomal protein S4 [Thermotogota bacterium]
MARYTGPVCRLCRRSGEKLYLKGEKCFTSKCPFERRPYPPGQHGLTRKSSKMSIYGQQLREKQKVKWMYGMLESQFKRFFRIAADMPGDTGENFLSLLERRLDNVVYRAGFAKSRRQARQIVRHGHVKVNGHKVDIPSYIVKVGDVIEIAEHFKNNREIQEAVALKRTPPTWLEVDSNNLTAKVSRLPQRADITHPINERLIVEFYSR